MTGPSLTVRPRAPTHSSPPLRLWSWGPGRGSKTPLRSGDILVLRLSSSSLTPWALCNPLLTEAQRGWYSPRLKLRTVFRDSFFIPGPAWLRPNVSLKMMCCWVDPCPWLPSASP